jgi:hypothetical protein
MPPLDSYVQYNSAKCCYVTPDAFLLDTEEQPLSLVYRSPLESVDNRLDQATAIHSIYEEMLGEI